MTKDKKVLLLLAIGTMAYLVMTREKPKTTTEYLLDGWDSWFDSSDDDVTEPKHTLPDWVMDSIDFTSADAPRGIRNNNPGNIERTGTTWNGMSDDQSSDDRFIVFSGPEWGIRAMARILNNYQSMYGLDTIAKIIGRWAPSIENDTSAYAQHVAARLGVGVDESIQVGEYLPALVESIILHENGEQPYPRELISYGVSLA